MPPTVPRPVAPAATATRADRDIDAIFDLRAIFPPKHSGLTIETMPALLRPQKGRYGLRDSEKVFSADDKPGSDICTLSGVDRTQGALVVVRPDQYIARVLPQDPHQALASFFARFMLPE